MKSRRDLVEIVVAGVILDIKKNGEDDLAEAPYRSLNFFYGVKAEVDVHSDAGRTFCRRLV